MQKPEIFTITPPKNITIKENDTQKQKGQTLWNALNIEEAFEQAYQESGNAILPLIIESDDPQTLQLPWELLYHERYGFLATHSKFTLSRKIPNLPTTSQNPKKEPLRVLFFSTLPDDLSEEGRLAVENEQVAVLEALLPSIKEGEIEIQIPNDGRFDSLKHYMDKFKPHLVFMSGHSFYHEGKGYFLFEDKRGLSVDIDEEALTDAFIGSEIGCVVLSSCQSAQSNDNSSGLAMALAQKGVNGVIGMSESIYDKAGSVFAKSFMESLASKNSVAVALQKGREAISKIESEVSEHFYLPLLLSQNFHAPLVDWDFEATPPIRELTRQKLNQISFDPLFMGRRKEFRIFYNYLYDNKLKKLLIFGEGGRGKTALAGHFALKLRQEGYKILDYSLKSKKGFNRFLMDIKKLLNKESLEEYKLLEDDCSDELCKAEILLELLMEEHRKVVFIFDNLESIQNEDTKELKDERIKSWIEAISQDEDAILLMTSRWLIPNCKETIQLSRPLKGDFLYYLTLQDIDLRERTKIEKINDTMGGNYRGVELFIEETKGSSLSEDDYFDEMLSLATKTIQDDMNVEKTLQRRTQKEIELLHRITVYPVSVPREGVRKVSLDLPKEDLDNLVSFSLIEKSKNAKYHQNEYQISALVFDFIAKDIKLHKDIWAKASEYQFWLFENERKNLIQALIAYKALEKVERVEVLEEWLFDEGNKEDIQLRGLVLNQIAVQHYDTANYDVALKYLEYSLKIMITIDDKSGEGAILNNISQIYQTRGDLVKALDYLERVLQIDVALGNKSGEGVTLNNISYIYYVEGNLSKTLEYLEKSLRISTEIGNKSREGTILNNISQIYKKQGSLSKALEYLDESLKIHKAIGAKEEGITLNNIGQIYSEQGDLSIALEYLEKSLKIQVATGNKVEESTTLNNIALIYQSQGNLIKAMLYLEKSLKISIEIGYESGEGNTLNTIGQIYMVQGYSSKALEYLEKSLKIQAAIGDKAEEGTILNYIATIYHNQGDLSKALEYLEKLMTIQVSLEDKLGEGETMNHIALIYKEQGNLAQAMKYLEKLLKMDVAIGDKLGEGRTLNFISQIYHDKGDLLKALKYLEKSLKIRVKIGDKLGEGRVLNNIALIYFDLGNLSKALEFFERSLKISIAICDKSGEEVTLNNISKIYDKLL